MKTLITLSFAVDLDEDDLVEWVRMIDQSIFDGIRAKLPATMPEGVEVEDIESLIDFYGATFTPRRDIMEYLP